MSTSAPKLRIGDFCRFDGRLSELIALDGLVAKLRQSDGQLSAVKLAELFADSGFEIVTPSVRRRPVPPAHFDTLTVEAQERALLLEHHITEVLDGVPVGSPPLSVPRPGYDPVSTSLTQRERTKIAELEAAGVALPIKSFQRYRRNYERLGLAALIDGRSVKQVSPTGNVDSRYISIVLEVLSENNTQSTRTETALKWHVDRRVEQRFGVLVPIPSYQTFNRLMKRLPQARHATGSARTRQSRDHQPNGPFGTVVATRPGEWMQIDTTPFDVGIQLDDSVKGRVELTGLVDVATRTICAAVLRPTTKAVDAALILAKAMTPETDASRRPCVPAGHMPSRWPIPFSPTR